MDSSECSDLVVLVVVTEIGSTLAQTHFVWMCFEGDYFEMIWMIEVDLNSVGMMVSVWIEEKRLWSPSNDLLQVFYSKFWIHLLGIFHIHVRECDH